MFERFTDRARRALVLAQEEARLLAHPYMGTEHLLLGLIGEADGIAAHALEYYGITLEVVRSVVEEVTDVPGSALSGSPPFTPRAKKVLELSLRDSIVLGHSHIGTEHMLLGLLREGEGVGATIILSLDVGLGELRDKVIALISDQEEDGESEPRSRAPAHVREEAPRCPRCGAGLAAEARYRVLDVPPQDPAADDRVLSVPVLFCNRCGRAFGSFDVGRAG